MKYILSVSEINRYIKDLMSRDLVLSNLWVRGEVSNCKIHYSGHIYFTLKDEGALLKSVMFKSNASLIKFNPENGMKVIIRGYVSVFERDGQYQLYAEEMQPDGTGSLHMAFEQLKKKLESEGLFSNAYKKKIPFLPNSIGVITSSTGSVIRDIINIAGRRFPNTHIKIFPVAVQGETAALQIAGALRRLNEKKCVDVIILARGGGSLEELWAFNEEVVARSIFKSEIPVISAIGHETDFTIADFVADLRAPTPSAAAELVVPEKLLLEGNIKSLRRLLVNNLAGTVTAKRALLERFSGSIVFRQPFDRIYQGRMKLDIFYRYMQRAVNANIERMRADFSLLAAKLDALSPLTILARGYGVLKTKKDGKTARSVMALKEGEELEVRLQDGSIDCTIKEIHRA